MARQGRTTTLNGLISGPNAKTGGVAVGYRRRPRLALLATTALQAAVLTLVAGRAAAQPAPNAHPYGGQVVGGAASISQNATTTTINQSSQRAALNWQGFDVGSGQTVQFVQPNAQSIALNTVLSANPSMIAGQILANGQIVLVNQSGVLFYRGAQVNTASLNVSAAGITTQNFMAGKMVFDQAPHPGAIISNAGNITVSQAGLASLVAPQVRNSGTITARLGTVILGGATTYTLDLYGDGLLMLNVTGLVTKLQLGGQTVTALVTNSGVVTADGGTVVLTAAAVDGLIQTLVTAGGSISAQSVGAQAGRVLVQGVGGGVDIEGDVTATGTSPGSVGGTVVANASGTVTVGGAAVLDVSGDGGGGLLAVGTTAARAAGGQSVHSTLTAQSVSIAAGATLRANAGTRGNGGTVVVLSSVTLNSAGTLTARGGSAGGNGGSITLASSDSLSFSGSVDVGASNGRGGNFDLSSTTVTLSGPLNSQCSNYCGSDKGGLWEVSAIGTSATSGIIELQNTIDLSGNTRLKGLVLDASYQIVFDAGSSLYVTSDATHQSGFLPLWMIAGSGGIVDHGSDVIEASDIYISSPGAVGISANVTATMGGIVLFGAKDTFPFKLPAGSPDPATPNSLQLLGLSSSFSTLTAFTPGETLTFAGGVTIDDASSLVIANSISANGVVLDLIGGAVTLSVDAGVSVNGSASLQATANVIDLSAGGTLEALGYGSTAGTIVLVTDELELTSAARAAGHGSLATGENGVAGYGAGDGLIAITRDTTGNMTVGAAGDTVQSADLAFMTTGTLALGSKDGLTADGAVTALSINGWNAAADAIGTLRLLADGQVSVGAKVDIGNGDIGIAGTRFAFDQSAMIGAAGGTVAITTPGAALTAGGTASGSGVLNDTDLNDIVVGSAGTLILGGIDGLGDRRASSITIVGAIDKFGTLGLFSGGDITEGAGGSIGSTNQAVVLFGSATGSIVLDNISGGASTNYISAIGRAGIASANSGIALSTNFSAGLQIDGLLSASTLVSLTTTGGTLAGIGEKGGDVTSGTFAATASAGITLGTASFGTLGTVQADILDGAQTAAAGGITITDSKALDVAGNVCAGSCGTLAGATAPGGAVTLDVTGGTLSIGSDAGSPAISLTGTAISLTASSDVTIGNNATLLAFDKNTTDPTVSISNLSGDIAIDGVVRTQWVGAGSDVFHGAIALDAPGGSISEDSSGLPTGTIETGYLTANALGSVILDNQSNVVGTLGPSSAGTGTASTSSTFQLDVSNVGTSNPLGTLVVDGQVTAGNSNGLSGTIILVAPSFSLGADLTAVNGKIGQGLVAFDLCASDCGNSTGTFRLGTGTLSTLLISDLETFVAADRVFLGWHGAGTGDPVANAHSNTASLSITDTFTGAGTLGLFSLGNISEDGGALTGASLTVVGNAGIGGTLSSTNLTATANSFANLGEFDNYGSFTLVDTATATGAASLTVSGPVSNSNTLAGIINITEDAASPLTGNLTITGAIDNANDQLGAGTSAIALVTQNGSILQTGEAISAMSGDIAILSQGGSIVIGGQVVAGSVSGTTYTPSASGAVVLRATGDVTESANGTNYTGTILAPVLAAQSSGGSILLETRAGNQIGTLSAAVDNVDFAGITLNVLTQAQGDLVIYDDVTQAGAFNGSLVLAAGAGGETLFSAGGTIALNVTGSLQFGVTGSNGTTTLLQSNDGTLTTGELAIDIVASQSITQSLSTISAQSGQIVVTSTNGSISQTSSTITNSVTTDAPGTLAITLSAMGGDISQDGSHIEASTGNVSLSAGGTISQTLTSSIIASYGNDLLTAGKKVLQGGDSLIMASNLVTITADQNQQSSDGTGVSQSGASMISGAEVDILSGGGVTQGTLVGDAGSLIIANGTSGGTTDAYVVIVLDGPDAAHGAFTQYAGNTVQSEFGTIAIWSQNGSIDFGGQMLAGSVSGSTYLPSAAGAVLLSAAGDVSESTDGNTYTGVILAPTAAVYAGGSVLLNTANEQLDGPNSSSPTLTTPAPVDTENQFGRLLTSADAVTVTLTSNRTTYTQIFHTGTGAGALDMTDDARAFNTDAGNFANDGALLIGEAGGARGTINAGGGITLALYGSLVQDNSALTSAGDISLSLIAGKNAAGQTVYSYFSFVQQDGSLLQSTSGSSSILVSVDDTLAQSSSTILGSGNVMLTAGVQMLQSQSRIEAQTGSVDINAYNTDGGSLGVQQMGGTIVADNGAVQILSAGDLLQQGNSAIIGHGDVTAMLDGATAASGLLAQTASDLIQSRTGTLGLRSEHGDMELAGTVLAGVVTGGVFNTSSAGTVLLLADTGNIYQSNGTYTAGVILAGALAVQAGGTVALTTPASAAGAPLAQNQIGVLLTNTDGAAILGTAVDTGAGQAFELADNATAFTGQTLLVGQAPGGTITAGNGMTLDVIGGVTEAASTALLAQAGDLSITAQDNANAADGSVTQTGGDTIEAAVGNVVITADANISQTAGDLMQSRTGTLALHSVHGDMDLAGTLLAGVQTGGAFNTSSAGTVLLLADSGSISQTNGTSKAGVILARALAVQAGGSVALTTPASTTAALLAQNQIGVLLTNADGAAIYGTAVDTGAGQSFEIADNATAFAAETLNIGQAPGGTITAGLGLALNVVGTVAETTRTALDAVAGNISVAATAGDVTQASGAQLLAAKGYVTLTAHAFAGIGGNIGQAGGISAGGLIDEMADRSITAQVGSNLQSAFATLSAGTGETLDGTIAASGRDGAANPVVASFSTAQGGISLGGSLSAFSIDMQARNGGIVWNGATIETAGFASLTKPTMLVPTTDWPKKTRAGLFAEARSFTVQGLTKVTPKGAAYAAVELDLPGASGTIDFGTAGLDMPKGLLLLNLNGGTARGFVRLQGLEAETSLLANGSGRADLTGTVDGFTGVFAAGASQVTGSPQEKLQINDCPLQSVNCVLLSPFVAPVYAAINAITIANGNSNETDQDFELPVVAREDY